MILHTAPYLKKAVAIAAIAALNMSTMCYATNSINIEPDNQGLPHSTETIETPNINPEDAIVINPAELEASDQATLPEEIEISPDPEDPVRPVSENSVTPDPVGSNEKSYIITAVHDNLDNEDMYIFGRELKKLGYKEALEDTDVSKEELTDYLSRDDVTTLYHTGHGLKGGIATATDLLTVRDIKVNVENFIIATCLTLYDTQVKDAFSDKTNSILGYTKTSLDIVDNEVVERFGSSLSEGSSYMKAWYAANAPINSLSDRWCGYIREGENIVEYSARSSNVPQTRTSLKGMTSFENGKVKASNNLMEYRDSEPEAFAQLDSKEVTIDGSTGQSDVEFYAEDFIKNTAISKDVAVKTATAWLNDHGGIPADAVLSNVIAIESNVTGNDSAQTVAYVVRYNRQMDGMTMRSNGAEDYISVLVSDNNVTAFAKQWSDIQVKALSENKDQAILSASDAIAKAAADIARSYKGDEINIIGAEPCYGMDNGQLVPAYELMSTDGTTIVLNAVTGAMIQ